jgi:hypothetical protein
MKSFKTTIAGALLALLMAVQPVLDGSGYHLDSATLTKLVMAGLIAFLGYVSKDHE